MPISANSSNKKADPIYLIFVLGFPVLFLLGCIIENLFLSHVFSQPQVQSQISLLQETVFLNASHVFMSFLFLGIHPAGMSWFLQNKVEAIKLILIVVGFAIAFFIASYRVQVLLLYLSLIRRFLAIHHNFSQHRGLWLLQAQQSDLSVWKRRITDYSMIAFMVFWSLVNAFHPNQIIILVSTLVFILPIFVGLFSKAFSTQDKIFSTRLFIPFLFPFSSLANYGMASIHGMEYVWVQHKQEQIRKFPTLAVILIVGLCIFASLCLGYSPTVQQLTGIQLFNESTVAYIASAIFGLSIGHYYLDRCFYSKRYAKKNEQIRQLLAT